jgi:hypothetical protein
MYVRVQTLLPLSASSMPGRYEVSATSLENQLKNGVAPSNVEEMKLSAPQNVCFVFILPS